MTRKRRRLWIVLACGLGLGSAAALSLAAFSDNMVFFVTPSDLHGAKGAGGGTLRLGGLVQAGTLQHGTEAGQPVATFRVTDKISSVPVSYGGILPDLFREGQGAVMLGRLGPDGVFRATEVLAKHDETYMPKDVADALKKSGEWRPEQGPPPPASTWNTISSSAGSSGIGSSSVGSAGVGRIEADTKAGG